MRPPRLRGDALKRIEGFEVLGAVVFAVLGVVAGLSVARLTLPSDEAILEAATGLVMADYRIEEVITGRPGENLGPWLDYRAGYRAVVRATGSSVPVDERQHDFEEAAAAAGWSVIDREDRPNAIVIRYERRGLVADASIRKASSDLAITAQRERGAVALRLVVGGLVGGLVGVAAVVAWRRRQDR